MGPPKNRDAESIKANTLRVMQNGQLLVQSGHQASVAYVSE
jgi:hypothetical protein